MISVLELNCGGVETLSRTGAAIALHCLQTFAPAGGAGHRTSLRGGGPLTTLLAPGTDQNGRPVSLWRTVWLNVLPVEGENEDPPPRLNLARIFPWIAPTRVSDTRAGKLRPKCKRHDAGLPVPGQSVGASSTRLPTTSRE
jgi:CRISPR type I-E-associated protein CasA/Cse1